ncbi:hypothetical protein IKA15_00100 [bacterium]|nr:hypothetical protein [bacterium]
MEEKMQAVINEKINLNVIDGVGTLIKRLEEADNSEKNTIENKIVAMGERVVEYLADILPTLEGVKRGVVAMSLIRIGEDALSALQQRAEENKETAWIYNYLISEIR